MRQGMSVLCAKEPDEYNIVPDYGTLIIHFDVEDAYSRQVWHPGEILAVWHSTGRYDKAPSDHARLNFPESIWVWTPGGRVAVDLRHTTWDSK